MGIGLETTGVDDDEFVFAKLGIAVMPITRETGVIRHDRITRFGKAVEQCGLAHIGTADERQNRFQNINLRVIRSRSRDLLW